MRTVWSRRSVMKMRLNMVNTRPGRREGDLDGRVASLERVTPHHNHIARSGISEDVSWRERKFAVMARSRRMHAPSPRKSTNWRMRRLKFVKRRMQQSHHPWTTIWTASAKASRPNRLKACMPTWFATGSCRMGPRGCRRSPRATRTTLACCENSPRGGSCGRLLRVGPNRDPGPRGGRNHGAGCDRLPPRDRAAAHHGRPEDISKPSNTRAPLRARERGRIADECYMSRPWAYFSSRTIL